jgi:5-keto 4-deoxyuronate isomerase
MARDYVTMYECDKCGAKSINASKFRKFGMVETNDKYINESFIEICIDCIPEFLGIDVLSDGDVINTLPSSMFEDEK